MNRRDLLKSAFAISGAGALGRYWPRLVPPAAHPLALSPDVLAVLRAAATPTLLGIGLTRPHARASAFDTVTPNNALKWRHVERYGWGDADALAALGKPIRAHTPLWGDEQGRTPPDEAEGFMREIARRYGRQIYAWDIVNELLGTDY